MSDRNPTNSKKSICILNSAHSADDTRVHRIATTLAECGYSITMISPVIPPELIEGEYAENRITYIKNRIARGNFIAQKGVVANLRTFASRLLVSSSLFIKGWNANADIYHCNEVDSWFVGIGLKLLRKRKLIFDVHEYYPSIITDYIPGKRLKLVVEKIVVSFFSLLSRFTDQAIFVNESIAALYNFKCNQIILRNLIRIKDIESGGGNQDLEEMFKDKLVLLHVGPLREAWGTSVLLDALGELKGKFPFVLIVLGGIADGEQNYEKKVQVLGLEGYLHIVDHVPFHQVVDYLYVANIGLIVVQPWRKSFIYSLPRKFLEYIGAGLPVIASDFPEIRRLIEKYQIGLVVNPESPTSLGGAIEMLVRNPDLRKQMSANCKTAFHQELNWEQESIRLIEMYEGFARMSPLHH